MKEQGNGLVDEPEDDAIERPDPSGIVRVDAVVAALSDLDRRDLTEHPAAFEHAHAELRRALDEPAEPARPAGA